MDRAEEWFQAVKELSARSEAGSEPDTEEAINLVSRLLTVSGDPFLWGTRGYNLMLRFERHGSLEDLNGAVVDFKRALAATPPDDVAIYHRGLNVAWASEARFDRVGAQGEQYMVIQVDGVERWRGPRDLVQPMFVLESLLVPNSRRPPGPPEMIPLIKRNLGNLLSRYAVHVKVRPQADRVADMRRAVDLLEQAMRDATPGSADYVTIATGLMATVERGRSAGLLPARYVMAGDDGVDPELLQQALDVVAGHFEDATIEPALRVRFELNVAAELERAGRVDEASAMYRQMAAVGATGPSALSLTAATRWADCAFAREAWNEVVEAQRCGVAHLEALRSRQGTWSSRYVWSGSGGRLAAMAAFALARADSAGAAAAVLEEGRTMMLVERLGFPSTWAAPVATGGHPVVHLLATEAGGLALLSDGSRPGRALWLDKFGQATFLDRLRAYTSALDGFRDNSGLGFEAWIREVASMVAFLGDALEQLIVELPDGPLTLIPVGVMALLPISAAILSAEATHRCVATLPSLRLGGGGRSVAAMDRVLVVADFGLPSARWEAAGVRGFFSASATSPARSSAAEIIKALPSGGVAHFACHGEIELGKPLHSGVIFPSGDRLTVEQILAAELPPVRMVVLSACESGVPDPYALDEGISLPAALLAAGIGGVVSTLWLVEDLSCALLVLRFYWEWIRQGRPAPLALARAQQWQRSTSDSEKCDFIEEDLIGAALLGAGDGRAMVDRVHRLSNSMARNSFEEPYYWAGFCFSGH